MSAAAAPAAEPARPVRPSVLARAPRGVLITALMLSVLAHTAALVRTLSEPIGYVDPAALNQPAAPVRIKRATVDYAAPTAGPGAAEAEATPLDELSAALLAEAPPDAPAAPDPPDPPAATAPEAFDPAEPAQASGGELDDLLASLPIGPLDTAGGSPAPGRAGDGAAGTSGGTSGGASGGAAGSARDLLRSAGLAPAPPPPASRAAPEPREAAPAAEDRLADAGPAPDPLDFTELALDAATQLQVPERLDNDFDYFVARHDEPGEPGYFRVDIVTRRSLRKLQTMPKDVIFLVDTSSSIPQRWVEHVVAGIGQALPSLNPDDRFNIVLFNEQVNLLRDQGLAEATPANLDAARAFLTEAKAVGYTDVNAALRRLLVRDLGQGRVYELILISDGVPTRGVQDTRELINLITRDNDLAASIYCVGVGRQQDRELLNFLAYRNKGFSVFVDQPEDAPGVIRDLMSRLRYPIIQDVRLSVAGAAAQEVYPVDLPNIHQGERFSVFGRYIDAEPFTMRITGRSAGRPVDFTFTRDLRLAPAGEPAIARSWGFWKLHHLYSEIIRLGERPDLLRQIERLRDRYGLETVY